MKLNERLVEEMRELTRAGRRPSQLTGVLAKGLGVPEANMRMLAIAYVREAFFLPLADAMRIGALPVFGEEGRAHEDVDRGLMSLIAERRPLWDRSE